MIFDIPKSLRPLVRAVSLYELNSGEIPVLDGKSMAVLHMRFFRQHDEENWVVVLELDDLPPKE